MSFTMTHSLRLLIVTAIGYSIALVASPAWSQVAAHATTVPASPDAQLKALRQELSALEGRVHELEKKAEDVKNNDDESPQAKKVEQRLAAIEKAQAKLEAEEAGKERTEKGEKGEEAALSHAKAPFVVYDDDGHVIFRVEVNGDIGGGRVIVGNAVGARVVIATSDQANSTAIRMFSGKNASQSDVALVGGAISQLQMKSSQAKHETLLGTGTDGRYGLFLSGGEIGSVALMSTPSGAGYLEIANNKGQLVAEGGANPKGVGIFLTGPSCCDPPDAVGPHQYILGRNR